MKTAHSGFTLIELLVVVAIIGILAAIAMPFYQGYVVQAKLSEVENAMGVLKSAVSAYHMDNESSWPNCGSIDEISNSLGVGLKNLTRIREATIVGGVITITVDNISPLVNGKTLSLNPTSGADGSIRWQWGWSADFPTHLRPKAR